MSASSILGVFAKSPFKPLLQHILQIKACVELLIPFFEAANHQQWSQAQDIRTEIIKLENRADKLKRDIRLSLPTGLFLPVARVDLLELVSVQDHMANSAKDISGVIIGRRLQIPLPIQNTFMTYLALCIDATKQATQAISELNYLLESSFSGPEVTFVQGLIRQLDTTERETDGLQVKLRAQLYVLEDQLNPIDVMFLYTIMVWVGDLADTAEKVGARLELMLARA
ncbi:MAG: TIGR00153 family protein [Pseudomonadales bacterium]|nr:TIGR00153 family protein [Pseudomonadales bacterium]